MEIQMPIIKDIKIIDTAYGGYGVAKDSTGKVIFIPHTVEGDTVSCEITETKKSLQYATLVDVVTPSELRSNNTSCNKYGICGGCTFAHIEYNAQLDIKKKFIKNAFRNYKSAVDFDITKSPQAGYRLRTYAKIQGGKIGLYKFKSNDFIEVDECPILKKSLFDKIKLFAKKNPTIIGELYAIEADSGIVLASFISDVNYKKVNYEGIFDGISVNRRKSGVKNTAYNTHYGAVNLGADTFFQSNHFLLDDLQKYAVELVSNSLSIVELYAGTGFFTSGLIKSGDYKAGVESDENSSELGEQSGFNIKNLDAYTYLQSIEKIDAIFLDPPREGLEKRALAEILRLKPLEIIYVSCDPTTLARDLTRLEENYKMEKMHCFDLYPDTFHIEIVTKLVRR